MSINVSRRNITAGISSSLVAPVLMLTASESSAFLPFLLRFIFQGVVRSTATRTVATTATRTLSSGAIRTVTTQFKSVVNLGITTTGIAAVSSGVYALADKHRAEQIWVSGTEYLNKFVLTTEKAISEPDRLFYGYRVIDTLTGQVEATTTRVAFPQPGKQPLELPFDVKPLPNTGLKRVVAFTTLDEAGLIPHPRFRAPDTKLVVVASLDEVTFG